MRTLRLLMVILAATATASCVSISVTSGAATATGDRAAVERRSIVDPLGRRLSFLRSGDPRGRRVIYVHGTPGDAASWMEFLAQPIEGTESLALDRPGFGRSAGTGAVPSLREQAAALEPLLSTRDGRGPILVGHSLGGPIVARAAVDFPDRVGGIVIVAGSMDPDLEQVLWIQHIARAPIIRGIVPAVLANTNAELLPLGGELRSLRPLLSQIRCPVYIVHGDRDGLVPYANVRFMEQHLSPGAIRGVETLHGGNHFVPWNNGGAIRQAVRVLMEGTNPPPPVPPTP